MEIRNDDPREAEPATAEERAAILDKLSQYVTTNFVLTLDGEKRQGAKLEWRQLELPFGVK